MTTYKTAELEGAQLDAAAAKALGHPWRVVSHFVPSEPDYVQVKWPEDEAGSEWDPFRPSTSWDDAGPLIEREQIAIYHEEYALSPQSSWVAGFNLTVEDGIDWGGETGAEGGSISLDHSAAGPTPLIAAMRAFVASKFGETVELP